MTDSYLIVADAAARDSRIPHPTPGQAVMLISTGEVLYWYGGAIGWQPPWNTAWGIATPDVSISSPVTITQTALTAALQTPLPGLQLARFDPIPGRRYEAVFDGVVTSNAPGDIIQVVIQNQGIGEVGFFQTVAVSVTNPATAPTPVRFAIRYGKLGLGELISVAAIQISGTGGLVYADANYGSRLMLNDIGSKAAPVYG